MRMLCYLVVSVGLQVLIGKPVMAPQGDIIAKQAGMPKYTAGSPHDATWVSGFIAISLKCISALTSFVLLQLLLPMQLFVPIS